MFRVTVQRPQQPDMDELSVPVHLVDIAVGPAEGRIGFQRGDKPLQMPRVPDVVVIEEGQIGSPSD